MMKKIQKFLLMRNDEKNSKVSFIKAEDNISFLSRDDYLDLIENYLLLDRNSQLEGLFD